MTESGDIPADPSDGSIYPRISIVTPSYNQAQYLEETIRSVLLQNYPDLEYIVMDGGSTDGSVEIIRKYEPWINYLHIGPDGGQAAALRAGFARAGGEILAWLNSDDIYLPGTLTRVAAFFASHPRHVFIAGDVSLIGEASQPHGLLRAVASQVFLAKNVGGHGWWQPGVFWRRQAYEAVGGIDAGLAFCMDRDLFVRLCAYGKSACLRGTPLAAFRTHREQKSETIKDVFFREHELLLDRYGSSRWRRWRPLLGKCWALWQKTDHLIGGFARPVDVGRG